MAETAASTGEASPATRLALKAPDRHRIIRTDLSNLTAIISGGQTGVDQAANRHLKRRWSVLRRLELPRRLPRYGRRP